MRSATACRCRQLTYQDDRRVRCEGCHRVIRKCSCSVLDWACDFCHQRGGVRWEYPATDFIFGAAAYDVDTGKVMMERELHSKGGWAACQRCADLVDSGYYDTLAFVCAGVDLERTRHEDLRPGQKSVLLTMRGAISAFRANRVGRRRPFNPDTP